MDRTFVRRSESDFRADGPHGNLPAEIFQYGDLLRPGRRGDFFRVENLVSGKPGIEWSGFFRDHVSRRDLLFRRFPGLRFRTGLHRVDVPGRTVPPHAAHAAGHRARRNLFKPVFLFDPAALDDAVHRPGIVSVFRTTNLLWDPAPVRDRTGPESRPDFLLYSREKLETDWNGRRHGVHPDPFVRGILLHRFGALAFLAGPMERSDAFSSRFGTPDGGNRLFFGTKSRLVPPSDISPDGSNQPGGLCSVFNPRFPFGGFAVGLCRMKLFENHRRIMKD